MKKVIEVKNGTLNILEKEEITLEYMQSVVEGYVETIRFPKNIIIWCNEEGKIVEGFKPSLAMIDGNSEEVLDYVYGNLLITSTDGEDTTGLTEEQILFIVNNFQEIILERGEETINAHAYVIRRQG